ncbi:MAG: hypothetical protein INR68_18845, partial [Methylobacterium mesophilicum]|nr:hypothetical protein [Methylobacterium mesophilicum]
GPAAPAAQKAAAAAKQAGAAAQQAASAYDNLLQKTRDRIEELDLETRSVGQSSEAVIKLKLAHDLERAAKKDGIEITAQMRAEYDKLGTTLATSTENLAQAKRQMEVTKDAQRELGSDFATFADDVVLGGKKMGEAFASLAKTLASGSLKALLTGEGGMAGLFGTAPEKSGELGGIFGNLFSGKGGLGGLFNTDAIEKAVKGGAESGILGGLGPLLEPSKTPQGVSKGILGSPLGQGLGIAAAGASIGYASQSLLMGAGGGLLAGLATGNPIMAAVGGAAGLLGGHVSDKPSTKKDRANERRRRFR